ncbi:hypothetical protein KIN20_015565, partial [Parelaphostrongylus tenuis]
LSEDRLQRRHHSQKFEDPVAVKMSLVITTRVLENVKRSRRQSGDVCDLLWTQFTEEELVEESIAHEGVLSKDDDVVILNDSDNDKSAEATRSQLYGPSEHILEDPIFESIEKWKKIELPLETSSNLPGDTSTFLDFFNMLNADATAVGCYSASCVDGTSTACVFSHPVPQNGARVYTPGNPCVSGGKCNSPKIGACEYGLCVITA